MSAQREMASAFTEYGVTDAERQELETWAEHDGHCSACLALDVKVAHIGVREKAHVGICSECLGRMWLSLTTLPEASPTGCKADG